MKKFLTTILILLAGFNALRAQGDLPRPKLVVGIVVDQMRWDYLYRYYSHYGNDGFRRLLREGFSCEQTMINYLPSFTAPGHASIWTGAYPALHGIAGNEWMEGGKTVYCTDDKSVSPVGGSWRWGRMSPKNMYATTLGDELRLATNFRSRVFGISLKDRSSILPAGHDPSGAFWFDDSTGNFSTSTYYSDTLPAWVEKFNARRLPDSILAQDWDLLDDSLTYTQSTPNNPRYEGLFDKEEAAAVGFSHRHGYFTGTGATRYNAVRKLPLGNWLTLQFAKQCIRAEGLGSRRDPDMLCMSLSATDYAGHQFGPNAVEMEDMYLRLDEELGRFLHFLDRQIGEGQYTVFLTADHGAASNSLFLNDNRIPAGNLRESQVLTSLNSRLRGGTGLAKTVTSLDNYQVFLSDSVKNGNEVLSEVENMLSKDAAVQFAFRLDHSDDLGRVPEPVRAMAVNGHVRNRSGVLQVVLKPGYYAGYTPTGTTHGTWNPYDTHIPLLWYGWGIRRGSTTRRTEMTDIAPTISVLLHIQMPNACVGKPVSEAIKEPER